MEAKVEVKTIPLHGLFIHRKQVWRSLGKLRAESHSTSAQKVFMNEHMGRNAQTPAVWVYEV